MKRLGVVSALLGTFAVEACASTPPPAAAVVDSRATLSYDSTFSAPGLSLRLELAPLQNLIYQLDCLSGAVLCSPDAYRALWAGADLGLDADDEAALERWKTLRRQHTGTMRADALADNAPLLLSGARVDLAERQRIAALRAKDLDGFEAAVALLSSDAEARALREICLRFEPRFMRYWRRQGLVAGAQYFAEMSQLLADSFLLETLARVSRFVGLPANGHETFRIHLMLLPRSNNPRSTAYQLEQDFVVEAREQGKAIDVIDVVTHELCHALVFRMPTAAKSALAEVFLRSEDAYSLVDYSMFDEALATSVGNGLVWRHYHPSEDFEQHRGRNFRSQYKSAAALAAALLPELERTLFAEESLASPAFVQALGRAARASYREHGPTPLDYLHGHVLAADPALVLASSRVRDAAFAGFPYLREFSAVDPEAQAFILQHTQLSAAVYVSSLDPVNPLLAQLQLGSGRSEELRSVAERTRGFVYAWPRTPKTYFFLFVARDYSSALDLANAFIALRESRAGVLIELPR